MRLSLILALFWVSLSNVLGQVEICNDQKDNDGDGLIDCYDGDCTNNMACDDFYQNFLDTISECRKELDLDTNLVLAELWRTERVGGAMQTFQVGDIDNDGIIEVLVGDDAKKLIYVLSGISGKVKYTINLSINGDFSNVGEGMAIGDIDNDGFAEIFYHFIDAPNVTKLMCMNYQGTMLWTSDTLYEQNDFISRYFPALANFNEDDSVEVYIGNYILNAHTGMIIAKGDSSDGLGFSVAADVLDSSATCPDCNGLELVSGNVVYGVNIENKIMTRRAHAPPTLTDGFTSVADMDGDNKLDIVVNQSYYNSPSTDFTIYRWDPRTENTIGSVFSTTNGLGGRVNVGNFDADPMLEMGVAGSLFYVLIDDDMTEKWRLSTEDGSLHTTGSTGFDLDCDGKSEIIYRDERNLLILDGENGTIRSQTPCMSATWLESPVVADINLDGHADIVCGCGDWSSLADAVALTGINNNWAASRSVYNQYSYFSVNVNDDLTIPSQQQNHAHDSLGELNSFLNQAPILNTEGQKMCHTITGDVSVSLSNARLSANCQTIAVDIEICNISERKTWIMHEGTPYAFYDGDPKQGGSLIASGNLDQPVYVDSCISFTYFILPQGDYELFFYINDDGTDPLNAPTPLIEECDFDNNYDSILISSEILPQAKGDTICKGDTAYIEAYNGERYDWEQNSFIQDTSLPQQEIVNLEEEKIFTIIIQDSNNCIIEDTVAVLFRQCDSLIFIPNIFYVRDGAILNSRFLAKLAYENIDQFDIRVYDRWGTLIFESTDAKFTWDGYFKGQKVQQGAYVYTLEARFIGSSEPISQTGNITVLY